MDAAKGSLTNQNQHKYHICKFQLMLSAQSQPANETNFGHLQERLSSKHFVADSCAQVVRSQWTSNRIVIKSSKGQPVLHIDSKSNSHDPSVAERIMRVPINF
jgi:hypothetical protein